MHDAVRHCSKTDMIFAHGVTDDGASGTRFTYSIIPYGGREIRRVIENSVDDVIRGMDPRDHPRGSGRERPTSRKFRD